jgi:hypothetical protein
MKSPKLKRISYVKAGVLIVDQVKSAIFQGTAVRFDLSKGKGIKWASIFRTNLNDHLILIASFLNRCNLCKNRCHDWLDADFRQAAGVNAVQSKSSTHRKGRTEAESVDIM